MNLDEIKARLADYHAECRWFSEALSYGLAEWDEPLPKKAALCAHAPADLAALVTEMERLRVEQREALTLVEKLTARLNASTDELKARAARIAHLEAERP
jgi:hypothetical protein